MADSDQIEAIKEYILKHYDPSANGGEYWDGGNFDDTFQLGIKCGSSETLYDIGKILGLDLPPMEEVEF